jgi:hypothetical protein
MSAAYNANPEIKNQNLHGLPLQSCFGPEIIGVHQVAIFVLCGGGHLGRWAAENPADFYLADRVGRLPYGLEDIRRAVATLTKIAQTQGLNPHDLPVMPLLHSFGIL